MDTRTRRQRKVGIPELGGRGKYRFLSSELILRAWKNPRMVERKLLESVSLRNPSTRYR